MTTRLAVRVEGLCKAYGRVRALEGMGLSVASGGLLALLGPSGCGKTTALRLIAGLDRPDSGRIELGGRLVAGPGVNVPPERRGVGMVFQDYALFPHLTVAANVGFGLPRTLGRTARVEALLAQVGLSGLGERYPHELSGGQQQRVALARALAPGPQVLLLDEPFSNLDAELRVRVRAEVRAILAEAGVTVIFVTHDRDEALSLADEVAVMQAGRILQSDRPEALYHCPASPTVAAAVGDADFLQGVGSGLEAACELGTVSLAKPAVGPVRLLLRPESVCLEADSSGAATVGRRQFFGREQLVDARLPSGATVRARLPPDCPLPADGRVAVRVRQPLVAFAAGSLDAGDE
jgi:iron(III) transport system ATP-binding protein